MLGEAFGRRIEEEARSGVVGDFALSGEHVLDARLGCCDGKNAEADERKAFGVQSLLEHVEVTDLLFPVRRFANEALRPDVHRSSVALNEVVAAGLVWMKDADRPVRNDGDRDGLFQLLQLDRDFAGEWIATLGTRRCRKR